jgi:hypothetical protein
VTTSTTVPRAHEPRRSVADDPAPLLPGRIEPAVDEFEPLAAVIDLLIVDARRTSVPQHDGMLRAPVAHTGHGLRQMDHRVAVVSHAQEQHVAVQSVDTPDGTVRPVREIDGCAAVIRAASGPDAAKACGESLRRTPGRPRKVSATTPMPSARRRGGIEHTVVVVAHARHDERAAGSQSRA